MEAFTKHEGVIALLDTANVDTDQIIAKQFLKSIKRTGFGEHLFHDWRYKDNGELNQSFSLNDPKFKNASVLVTRNNFGCGSSREHAVWAIQQYGFRAIIAPRKDQKGGTIPGFADIFRNNCGKNGLLTIELSEAEINEIFESVSKQKGVKAFVDLDKQELVIQSEPALNFSFDVDAGLKERLLKGLDDIGITLHAESAITAFEKRHNPQMTAVNAS